MNKKVIAGLAVLGIAGVFIALSMLFLSRAMSIIDYGEVNIPGIGCDTCEFSREFLSNYSLVFVIIGGVLASLGARLLIRGHREIKKNTGIVRG